MSKQNKPTLLVAKGDMSRLGGAERDLIRRLPHLTNYFDVKVSNITHLRRISKFMSSKFY